jgi:heat shock protein HslJ
VGLSCLQGNPAGLLTRSTIITGLAAQSVSLDMPASHRNPEELTVEIRLRVVSGILLTVASLAAAGEGELPAGLHSPDHWVVCNQERGACYDRYGPSIGLTQAFLGQAAADRLTAALRAAPPGFGPDTAFSPAVGVECQGATGPCRAGAKVLEGLTAVLYGPWPEQPNGDAEARAAVGVDWKWVGTRYNNEAEARPADPSRYVIRLEPGGSLRVRADCNGAGGTYLLEQGRITINITHSTMAACEPDSLERVFLRDLSAAAVYFLQDGGLYLDLKDDTGTMGFGQ